MKNLNIFKLLIFKVIIFTAMFFLNYDGDFLRASLVDENILKEDFIECLKEKEIRMYGNKDDIDIQRIVFKEIDEGINYINCIEEESQMMTFDCQKKEIKTFPTWKIIDNKKEGFLTVEKLELFTGCFLE